MDDLKPAAKAMWDKAREHGDRYLLPRRHSKGDPVKDAEYATADWLVSMGYARWVPWGSTFAPGITLTGRPWRDSAVA